MARRALWTTIAVAAAAGGAAVLAGKSPGTSVHPLVAVPRLAPPPPSPAAPASTLEPSRSFQVPRGEAPQLTCDAARAIVAQARRSLAYVPEPVPTKEFVLSTADWLDPFGHWSASPDAPAAATLKARATALLADLEGRGAPSCDAALEVGATMPPWIAELRAVYDRAALAAVHVVLDDLFSEPVFEGGAVSRPGATLAAGLGKAIGELGASLGDAALPLAAIARRRYFPDYDGETWSRVVLAASVRAYVTLLDPHGAWAPAAEEASVYDVDLEARPPGRLWDQATRLPFGVRIDSGARAPLHNGDVLFVLGDTALAGMPFEQIEQLGFVVADAEHEVRATAIRRGAAAFETVTIDKTSPSSMDENPATPPPDELELDRVAYGADDVLVVAIHDVRDDLGELLTHALLRGRDQQTDRNIAAVVLDLRGNGGGSTDGAIDALGIFLPGAPLFPMRRRDGSLETDRAPIPPAVDRWDGPVAALVDGETASAAEMIAGAIASYRRGLTVGTTTFGKGCAQEYVPDDAQAGVLRVTTLLYALPDGTAVQRRGLSPLVRFPFGSDSTKEREALIPRAPPSWRGPDVRDRKLIARVESGERGGLWPTHAGTVGPCRDAAVCDALRMLGSRTSAKRAASRAKDPPR